MGGFRSVIDWLLKGWAGAAEEAPPTKTIRFRATDNTVIRFTARDETTIRFRASDNTVIRWRAK